ncbi:MAG: ATP-binding protein, partial [Planctomycetota bacterium]
LQPHNIGRIVEESLKSVYMPPEVQSSITTADNIPLVMVDENQIPMAFKNLIRNARDAMPSGGEIDIRIASRGDRVQVEVRDTGVGITPEDLVRVTEPLYSTKARGMGLGLAITLAILDKNSGSLEIESEVGKGSCFRVQLTAAQE